MSNAFDWNDLRFFLAVVRAGTISQAGRVVAADHATVARRISALESALRTHLFVRNARGYTLTRQGERLLETAQRIESEAAKLQELVGDGSTGATGTLRLSTPEGIGNFFLASRLSDFASKHKNLSVELLTIQQIISLSPRETDITITLSPLQSPRYNEIPLTDYKLFVYGVDTYLSQKPLIRSSKDFSNHDFIGYIDELIFTRSLNFLAEVQPGLKARLQCSSLYAQMEATCAGYGLCVLPAFIARHRPELVPVLPREISLLRTYWTVVHNDIASSYSVRLMISFIRGEVQAAQNIFLSEGP